jgi:hypothetical protein
VLEDDWGVKTEECAAGANLAITGWFQVLTVSIYLSRVMPATLTDSLLQPISK